MDAPMRNQEDTVAAFQAYASTGNKAELCELHLKPWMPFWADLPHVDFPSCITPDILHQLHKGVFKDYVAEWTEELLCECTLDGRFMAMPQAQNLRHFKKGITSVQQWTGRERKEMVKQYLPIIVNDPNVPDTFVRLVRALLDFLYLAKRAQLTASELEEMEEALRTFHSLKKVLVELELVTDLDKFNYIPKFHMLGHYTHSIRELSTPDGYNTESPEHLHVVYVKRGWRASNQREAIKQIIDYIRHLDVIRIQCAYIDECFGECAVNDGKGDDNDNKEEDDDEGEERMDVETAEEKPNPAYPQPTLSMAVRPTHPHLSGHQLISTYSATDLIHSLTHFLKPLAACEAGLKPLVLASDVFDIWHKITLCHESPSFAPDEPPRRNIIRIRPPSQDEHSCRLPGLFDTALFIHQPQAVGLH
ncbi:hypothetical protein FRC08_010676, partial [Ceratobasidium sp. 394]